MRAPRKRIIFALIGALALLAIVGSIHYRLGTDKNDLMFAGKPLSEHLLRAYYDPIPPHAGPALFASQRAITELGTNCVPLLRKWLTLETADWRIRIGRQLSLKGIFSPHFPPIKPQMAALNALGQFARNGQLGVESLSALAPLCTNSNPLVSAQATGLLTSQITQMETLPISNSIRAVLESVLKMLDLSSQNDRSAAYRLAPMRGDVDDLQRFLGLKNSSAKEQAKELRVLSRRNHLYIQVRPYLVEHLHGPDPLLAENAALCFKNYGEKATNALSELEQALSHPDERVRAATSNALIRIKALSKPGR